MRRFLHTHLDRAAGWFRKGDHCVPKRSGHYPIAALKGDRSYIGNQRKTSNFWEEISASKFPHHFPKLYGLMLELRSLHGRIQLLWKRGDVYHARMGHVWEKDGLGHLLPNRRTQARIQDMQRAISLYPWLSPEDWNLFLLGWDAGSECNERADHDDIQEHSVC